MNKRELMRKAAACLVAVMFFAISFSQDKSVIEKNVYAVLQGNLENGDLVSKILTEPDHAEVCRSIGHYFADSTQKNRAVAFNLVKQLGKKHKTLQEQIAQVDALFMGLEHLSLKDSKPVFGMLKTYPKESFKENQISLIRDYLAHPGVERNEAMLLLGFVGKHSDIDYLQSMAMLYPLKKDQQYYFDLALIRLGDAEAKKAFLMKMENLKIEDEFVINNLGNAVYTHNSDIYKRLLKEILNEDNNCSSANNDNPVKIPCAYRIIEAIAPYIKDFPVKINRIGEIEGNPQEELQKARTWIMAHLQDFQVITSIY